MSNLTRIGPRCPNCETWIWCRVDGKIVCLNDALYQAIQDRDDNKKAEILATINKTRVRRAG